MTDVVPPPTPSDVLLARVILALGLIGVLSIAGVIVLATLDKPVPDVLAVTLGAVVGALGSVLAGRKA